MASGNVVFTNADGDPRRNASSSTTATGIGTFYDASGIMSLGAKAGVGVGASMAAFGGQDPDVYFYGQTLEKLGPRKYRITRGGFTTCVQPTPRWEMTSGSAVLNLDDYAIARNTLLKVKGCDDVLAHRLLPDQQSQRATCFLLPTYGASTLRGQSLSNASFGRSTAARTQLLPRLVHAYRHGRRQRVPHIAGPQSAGNVRAYRFRAARDHLAESGQTLPARSATSSPAPHADAGRIGARADGLDYFSEVRTRSSTIRTSIWPRAAAA